MHQELFGESYSREGAYHLVDSLTIDFQNVPDAEIYFPPLEEHTTVYLVGYQIRNCSLPEAKIAVNIPNCNGPRDMMAVPIMDNSTGALVNIPGSANPWLSQVTGSYGEHQTVYPSFSDQGITIYPGLAAAPSNGQGHYVSFSCPKVLFRTNNSKATVSRGYMKVSGMQNQAITFDSLMLDCRVVRKRPSGDLVFDPKRPTNSALTHKF